MQEVNEVRSKAAAEETYAKQARLGKEIELKMHEYILRAERRLGELFEAAKAAGQIAKGGNTHKVNVEHNDIDIVKLSEAGISRDLSSHTTDA